MQHSEPGGDQRRDKQTHTPSRAHGQAQVPDDAAVFEAERRRLTGIAYRMTGSVADAEDVVQEAWLRWQRTDTAAVANPAAWLTTATSRLAIDRLRAQQRRREDYVGPWLPEPVVTQGASTARSVVTHDVESAAGVRPSGRGAGRRTASIPSQRSADLSEPEAAAELGESLTLGFLVVLDRLGPVERAVFLLADVFGEPYATIADVVDRPPATCRQIASRARRKVRALRAEALSADDALLADLVGSFATGDIDRLLSLLAPEVVLTSDGGANRRAARRPVLGPERVARFLTNLASRVSGDAEISIEQVNAAPALVVRSSGETIALSADSSPDGATIVAVRLFLNPDKVGGLDRPAQFT